jgi:hypothetical protein
MKKLWPDIRALHFAKDLIATFGFSDRTLSAESVLIPIAH